MLLLREFHTTRSFLRAFQIDPFTAQVKTDPSSPRPSWNRRKPRESRAGNEELDGEEGLSDTNTLSTMLELHNSRVRYPRPESAKGMGSRRVRNQVVRREGRFSPSAYMERNAHPGASEDAGGSLPFPHCLFFIHFSVQSVPNDDRGNAPHLPDSLRYLRRVDGVIQPRTRDGPFLEGNVLFVATVNIPQPA